MEDWRLGMGVKLKPKKLKRPRRVIAIHISPEVGLGEERPNTIFVTSTTSINDQSALSVRRIKKLNPIGLVSSGVTDGFIHYKSELVTAKLKAKKSLSEMGYSIFTGSPRRVYVIALDSIDNEAWLYVGQTGISIEERIKQHKSGGRISSRVWSRMAQRVPSLEPDQTYWSVEDAEKAEVNWGLHLNSLGYRVVGPKGFSRRTGQPISNS